MPHCIIEHSANLSCEQIFPLVFEGVLQSGLFEPDGSDIKIRAISYHDYLVGGIKSDFVHIELKILSGISSQQKQTLAGLVLDKLKLMQSLGSSITVEVVDIDRNSYRKYTT